MTPQAIYVFTKFYHFCQDRRGKLSKNHQIKQRSHQVGNTETDWRVMNTLFIKISFILLPDTSKVTNKAEACKKVQQVHQHSHDTLRQA